MRLIGALLCGAALLLAMPINLALAQDAGAKRYGGMQFGGTMSTMRTGTKATGGAKSRIGHESAHVVQQRNARQKKPVGHDMSKSIIQNMR